MEPSVKTDLEKIIRDGGPLIIEFYFVETEHQLKRKVPDFYTDIRINIISQWLVFRSPFWFSRQIKKALGFLINCHRSVMEFYEQHLCYIFPCPGIEIVFTPCS